MLAYYELAYKNNKLAYLKIKWRFCVIVHAPLFVNAVAGEVAAILRQRSAMMPLRYVRNSGAGCGADGFAGGATVRRAVKLGPRTR
jgi:hypothetical protein